MQGETQEEISNVEAKTNGQIIVKLSLKEINDLTIDELLTYRHEGTKIELKSSPFDIKWYKGELDIDEERGKEIINAIAALRLGEEVVFLERKYQTEISDRLTKIAEEIKEESTLSIISDSVGIDIEGLISSKKGSRPTNVIPNSNNTMEERFKFLAYRLAIDNPTEAIFLAIALAISDNTNNVNIKDSKDKKK